MLTDQKTRKSGFTLRGLRLDAWTFGALAIALLVVAPMISVLWIAFRPTENIWPHLMASVLPRYLGNTVILMLGVGFLAGVMGTATAWLTSLYDFRGRNVLDYALFFPLAIPAYVGAYALVDFLEYAGPLQSGLRATFGWTDARDYWFPQVRSMWLAILVLGSTLYPYVYLMARVAFREQSGGAYEVARALGQGPWGVFFRLGLPLARPAISAGVALAMMEAVADFGTVQHFGVQTLTTGVFSVWLNGNNAGGAAQISLVILTLIFVLVTLERFSRRHARFYQPARSARPILRQRLSGRTGAAAALFCAVPFIIGFVLPVGVMTSHALRQPEVWVAPGLLTAAMNTLLVAGLAAGITVLAAVFLVYAVRNAGRQVALVVFPLTTLGYAAPGAVLAVGILIPLAVLDHHLADFILAISGYEPGLLLTGTATAIILAYTIRFFGIAQGAVDAAFGRISPSLPMVARALGQSAGGTLRRVHLPMIRGSIASATLVVFVDCVKELPATLLLRPFNFSTLSTRVYEMASLEQLTQAAPAALIVVAFGLTAVALLAHSNRAH
jgi:iron(III) transport system permease protein